MANESQTVSRGATSVQNAVVEDRFDRVDFAERWLADGFRVVQENPPGFSVSLDVEMTVARAVIDRLRQRGVRGSYSGVLARAAGLALARHQDLHAVLAGSRRLKPGKVRIGLSVANEAAAAPVLRLDAVEDKPLPILCHEIAPWVCGAPGTCSGDSTIPRCSGTSVGYSCTGSATPDQAEGSALSCGDGVPDPNGTSTAFCCATLLASPPADMCAPDSTVTGCGGPSVGYSCIGPLPPPGLPPPFARWPEKSRRNLFFATTAVQGPLMNAVCERFLGSVRRECLDHIVILSEEHLRHVLAEYARSYFNTARPHQGIGQRTPVPSERVRASFAGSVTAIPVLGGLHHEYRAAA